VAYPLDWFAVIFNPSFPYRLAHVLLSSGLTAAFLIAGISAYRLLRGDEKKAPRKALHTAIVVAAILAPAQALVGDFHGLNTLEHQPQKIAAMEGIWHSEKGAPLLLFAWPDEQQKTNHFELAIPKLASLILTHDWDGELQGLNEFEGLHPPVAPVFFAFRVMVGIGLLMIVLSWFAGFTLLRKKTLSTITLKIFVAMSFCGWIATLAGWYVTEIGRQPWLVQGVLKTADAVTDIAASNAAISLSLYLCLYAVLLGAYIHTLFLMARRAVDIEEMNSQAGVAS
jgi:cytochrome d ubiquinol oxidase subunit I